MASDRKLCLKCGSELQFRVKNNIQGLYCSSCNEWEVVTTYLPEIDLDRILYSVYLRESNTKSVAQIKAVSEVMKINFLEAKKTLGRKEVMVFSGDAREVKIVKKILDSSEIKYRIEPGFPYV